MAMRDIRANRSQPCRICGKANQWCLNFDDGNTLCMIHGGPDAKEVPQQDGAIGYLHIASGNLDKPRQIYSKPVAPPRPTIASVEKRHEVYKAMVSLCTLSDEHREHLNRVRQIPAPTLQEYLKTHPYTVQAMETGPGVNFVKIDLEREPLSWNFGTLLNDAEFRRWVCSELQLYGLGLEQVPGFYRDEQGRWTVAGAPGLLVPYLTPKGQIQGFQIRTSGQGLPRYMWLSSADKPSGTSSRTCTHFTHPVGRLDWWITEGGLKATVAANQTDEAFVGLSGCHIGAVEKIASQLQERPRLILCPDADYRVNRNVRDAWENNVCLLVAAGFDVRIATWEPEHKGIDDFILATGRLPEYVKPKQWGAMNHVQ